MLVFPRTPLPRMRPWFNAQVVKPGQTRVQGGVIGHDEDTENHELRACEFERIAGCAPGPSPRPNATCQCMAQPGPMLRWSHERS